MASTYYVQMKDASSNVYYPIIMEGSYKYRFITGSYAVASSSSTTTSNTKNFGSVYIYMLYMSIDVGSDTTALFASAAGLSHSMTNNGIIAFAQPYPTTYNSNIGIKYNIYAGFYILTTASSYTWTLTGGGGTYLALVYNP